MRTNTQKIYDLLSKGAFICVDSANIETRHMFRDIEENKDDYESYFLELGLKLESGDGYYYFSRIREPKPVIENKLESFSHWIDVLDFLKTYDIEFSTGMQFRDTQIIERIKLDVELSDKARKLYHKLRNNREIVDKLIAELTSRGYVDIINEQDRTYKVTSAFRYAEELVSIITIYNEEDIPEQ